jgi:hypothetical protein
MKKWIKSSEDVVQSKSEPAKSHSAYSRDRGEKDDNGKLAESLIAMTKAHNEKSASNKAIRNGFYGKKD